MLLENIKEHNECIKSLVNLSSKVDKMGSLILTTLRNENKVMICGSLEFNNDVKSILSTYGWQEGNKKTAGTFVQEKAFVSRNERRLSRCRRNIN